MTGYGSEAHMGEKSDGELLSMVLGGKISPSKAERILTESGGLLRFFFEELPAGVDPEVYRRVQAAQELVNRGRNGLVRLSSPKIAVVHLRERFREVGSFGMVVLGADGRVLAEQVLERGGLMFQVPPREFFRKVLRFGGSTALAFVVRKGEHFPSEEEKNHASRLRAAGESLGIPLSDFLILGGSDHYSFRGAEDWK